MGLGMPPKELCEIEDAARAVTQSLALLKQHANFSSQNLDLRNYDWDPVDRDESLSAVTDLAVPAWVQRKWSSTANASQDYWVDVRVCNLAELESSRLRGEWGRCAFYIDQDNLVPDMRIAFSYNPTDYSFRTHRLWYSPNPAIATAFNDVALDLRLLPQFFPLVSGMAELELIPTMRIRAAMDKNGNKDLVSAWDKRETYLESKVAIWTDRFKHFAYGERGNRKGSRRRTILPRGMRI
jgi:hypothetical protein